MKIDIGDKYVLTSDQFQYVIREKKIIKEGARAGEESLSLVGYFPKLSQAISALINLDVRMSDVKSLQDMHNHIERISKHCEKAFEGVAK